MRWTPRAAFLSVVLALGTAAVRPQDASTPAPNTVDVWLGTRDGHNWSGRVSAQTLHFSVDGDERQFPLADVLSLHMGTAASEHEARLIARDIPLLASADRQQAAVATDELLAIGLPVVTPLLQSLADTDAHEPDSRYRLFARLLPAGADCKDRSLAMLRLATGAVLRGKPRTDARLTLALATPLDAGSPPPRDAPATIDVADLRFLCVARKQVTRTFELHALHDCTYVDWVTTGIVPRSRSRIRADAQGFIRLSFDEDGWATGPDGLFETLPGKRKLQEGFRWGSVLYRVGPTGQRRYAGTHLDGENEDTPGMLQFVVNDNEHWQNNIGAYRVSVTVDDAFDVGPAH
ncbi:MAG: hypothetical protein R3F56_07555 [Planctomycetota bacterium]